MSRIDPTYAMEDHWLGTCSFIEKVLEPVLRDRVVAGNIQEKGRLAGALRFFEYAIDSRDASYIYSQTRHVAGMLLIHLGLWRGIEAELDPILRNLKEFVGSLNTARQLDDEEFATAEKVRKLFRLMDQRGQSRRHTRLRADCDDE